MAAPRWVVGVKRGDGITLRRNESATGFTPEGPQKTALEKENGLTNQAMEDGAGKRSRTPDLRITNALLYQLSYAGTRWQSCVTNEARNYSKNSYPNSKFPYGERYARRFFPYSLW